MATPPPALPDEIDLTPAQVEHTLALARKIKWGKLKRIHTEWQQLHCDLAQDEEGFWGYVRRERFADLEAPFVPALVDEVELNSDEYQQALFDMQQRVWGEQMAAYVHAQNLAAEARRKASVPAPFTAQQIADAIWRRGQELTGLLQPPVPFSLTPESMPVFRLMVYYFAGDEHGFLDMASQLGIEHPSLHKSLALLGPKGVGKTLLLRAAQHNPARPYGMVSAKKVDQAFRAGDDGLQLQNMFCGMGGKPICFDDVCTEEVLIKNYGNKENPMARVILDRYDRYQQGLVPRWATHLSSNNALYRDSSVPKDMPTWEELYGGRVVDRLHELCNIIPVMGNSRRL